MADQIETVPMDDNELFQGAMADEPPVAAKPEPEAAPAPQPDEQPRDEQGRFVPKEPEKVAEPAVKAEEQKPTPEADPRIKSGEQPEDAAQVPSWRLREVREAREAAERRANEAEQRLYAFQAEQQEMRRQLQQLQQPKAEPVDFFQNPDDAFTQRLTPIQEAIAELRQETRLSNSRALAIAEHGREAVNEMDQAIAKAMRENNPELHTLRAQLQASNDPVGLALQWHQRSKLWEMTGGNPDKYRQTILDEAMKDPKFQAKVLETARASAGGAQGNGTRPNIQLPPSLNKASGSGGNQASDLSDADMSDQALFRHALDSARR